jgi:hypothetical protein
MAHAAEMVLPLPPEMRANNAAARPVSAVALANRVQDLEIHR